jgi:SAM-dependent methyltransferase
MTGMPRYSEQLRELAAEAYELSGCLCGPCRDMHALWPYLRLSRMSTGVEDQASKLEALLRGLVAGGRRDVLIAGSQDCGLLALVARAGIDHATNIVVLDICETPLELCRRFAKQWSLPIETVRRDLLDLNVQERFDIVLVHGTLQYISSDQRTNALARIRRAMRPGGRLVLLFNTSRPVAAENAEQMRADYAKSVLDELKRLDVPLPDTDAVMLERLNAHARRRELREGAFAEPDDVMRLLRDASFKIDSCDEVDIRVASSVRGLISRISKRRFMAVAEPNGAAADP